VLYDDRWITVWRAEVSLDTPGAGAVDFDRIREENRAHQPFIA